MLLDNIRRRAKEMHLTISKLEELAGITHKTIWKWDCCRPSVDRVKAVADVLGCTVDDLLEHPEGR